MSGTAGQDLDPDKCQTMKSREVRISKTIHEQKKESAKNYTNSP